MTLTLYAGHILAIASPVQPFSPPVLFGLQALAVTGFALAWRWRVGRRGPLEAVVARLTDLAGPARRP